MTGRILALVAANPSWPSSARALLALAAAARTRGGSCSRACARRRGRDRRRRDPRRGTSRCCTRAGPDRAAAARRGLARARAARLRGAISSSGAPARTGRRRRSRCSGWRRCSRRRGAVLRREPLLESDGWVIWATRAPRCSKYGNDRSHPCSPTRASRRCSTRCCCPASRRSRSASWAVRRHAPAALQLLGLAIAFVGGSWVLLREQTPPVLLAATLVAVVTAPAFLFQLETNFADIRGDAARPRPRASLAAWLRSARQGLLPAAALFLGGGALTKNEGELFALLARRRVRRRRCFATAAARMGGAGDVPDRAALEISDPPARAASGRLLAQQPLRPRLPQRPPRPGSAVGERAAGEIVRVEGWTTCSHSSPSASPGRLCCAGGARRCSGRGAVPSFGGLLGDLLDLDPPDLEPPLQHVRSHDRHADDRNGDARARCCLAPEREPEPVEL